jgi:hypothetical protein
MKRKQAYEIAGLRDADQIRKNNQRSTRELLLYLLVFLLFVAVSLYVDRDSKGYYPSNSIPANDGWIIIIGDKDGNDVTAYYNITIIWGNIYIED